MLDVAGAEMCFPADHPSWRGLRYGEDESITTADVILVLECEASVSLLFSISQLLANELTRSLGSRLDVVHAKPPPSSISIPTP